MVRPGVGPQRKVRDGDKEDNRDENEQLEAAVRIISDPGQSDGGVLDALGNLVRAIRGTK